MPSLSLKDEITFAFNVLEHHLVMNSKDPPTTLTIKSLALLRKVAEAYVELVTSTELARLKEAANDLSTLDDHLATTINQSTRQSNV